MAATTLLSDNGVISGITGYTLTGGNDGTLQLQTTTAGGTATTAVTLDASQNTTVAGNLTLSGTGKRITGDFSNATVANRVAFQTSTVNGDTAVGLIPNGTSTATRFGLHNNSDVTNCSLLNLVCTSSATVINSAIYGTGTYLPMTFYTGGVERVRIDTSGNVGIGTNSPISKVTATSTNSVGTSLVVEAGASNTYTNGVGFNVGFNGTNWVTGAAGSNGGSFIGTDFGNGAMRFYTLPSTGASGQTISNASFASYERMRIDSSGNVGIGTSSPASKFHVEAGRSRFTANGEQYAIEIKYNNATNGCFIGSPAADSFGVYTAGGTERMRIDSSGNLLVGVTSVVGNERLNVTGASTGYLIRTRNTNASPIGLLVEYSAASPNNSGNDFIVCPDSTTTRFKVVSNGGILNYQANNVNLSDSREKTNANPAGDYLAKICAIPVRTYNYVDQNLEEDDGLTLGVYAQDVQAAAPELVTESNWGTEDEPKMRLSIYQTDLQYALMKCIQEQQALIEQLRADVETLKGNA